MLRRLTARFRKHDFEVAKDKFDKLSLEEMAAFYTVEVCKKCKKEIKYCVLDFEAFKENHYQRGCPGETTR